MSAAVSTSMRRPYGLARVCRVWGLARSGVYRRRRTGEAPAIPRRRPGPQGPMPDTDLLAAIRGVLLASPFHGEGYRKVWARLRHASSVSSPILACKVFTSTAGAGSETAAPPKIPEAPSRSCERHCVIWLG